MELVKENYNKSTMWLCPMCGEPFYAEKIDDANDDGTVMYMETMCDNCGAALTVVVEVSHVCAWKDED